MLSHFISPHFFSSTLFTSPSRFRDLRFRRKLKKSFGQMTQSTFIPYSSRVVTAMTSGEVVLWDYASADPDSPDAR